MINQLNNNEYYAKSEFETQYDISNEYEKCISSTTSIA